LNILLLSYYFPPDLSAGSFRSKALADAIASFGEKVKLDVITTSPNRYRSFQPESIEDSDANYRITRIALPRRAQGMKGQVLDFIRFARSARKAAPEPHYDLVVATSSRLMTACLGTWLARGYGAALYLDMRDIFVETFEDVFASKLASSVGWVFGRLERWVLRTANTVNLVSPGFLPYFKQRCDRNDYRFFTNGVDDEFVRVSKTLEERLPFERFGAPLNIVYAGNIGDGQGLDNILPELSCRLAGKANFTVIGDGGTCEVLRQKCLELGAPVELVAPVPREELLEYYLKADILFLHLNDIPAFQRVLPSKLFEYAALGRPILAGVRGYASEFVEEWIEGVKVFPPGDVEAAVKAFESLSLKTYHRHEFVERFARSYIMQSMARDVIQTGAAH